MSTLLIAWTPRPVIGLWRRGAPRRADHRGTNLRTIQAWLLISLASNFRRVPAIGSAGATSHIPQLGGDTSLNAYFSP